MWYCTNFTIVQTIIRKDILALKREEKDHERHIKLSVKSNKQYHVIRENSCSALISDEEAVTKEDKDNTHDEN